jgi:hypothetical protein
MKKYAVPLNEEGFILVITIIMLLIATIIGITAVTTSKTEVSISGNYKLGMQTFYTADSVTQYVLTNPTTFNMTNYAAPLAQVTFNDPSLTGSANVTFLSTALPPPGTSAKFFSSNYFVISTTGNGPLHAQETQILHWGEIVPKI